MEYDDPEANAYAKAQLQKASAAGGKRAGARNQAAGALYSTDIGEAAADWSDYAAAAPQGGQEEVQFEVPLRQDDAFDWESYIAPYKGHTRIARLAFIAEHCSALRVACADAALDQLQAETSNTVRYTALLQLRNTDPATGQPFADAVRLRKQDEAWLQETSKNIKLEEEKLDLELRNYQNNQIKESVRMANRDLGDFYRRAGHPSEALRFYQQTREYTNTLEHVLEMCLNTIEVALDQRLYQQVRTAVAKAEATLANIVRGGEASALVIASIHTGGGSSTLSRTAAGGRSNSASVAPVSKGASTAGGDAIGALFRAGGSATSAEAANASFGSGNAGRGSASTREAKAKKLIRDVQDKLNVASGIAAMGLRMFDSALRALSKVDVASPEGWAHLASPADIALYTAFCAAAILDRAELRRRLIGRGGPQSSAAQEASENASKNAEGGTATGGGITGILDIDPPARELVWRFYECDFRKVHANLDQWQTRRMLDLHLFRNLPELTTRIKTRCVQDFLRPYDTLALGDMAAAFGFGEHELLQSLVALLEEGRIDIRIDMQRKILTRPKKKDPRQDLYERAFALGEKRIQDCKRTLFRLELVQEK